MPLTCKQGHETQQNSDITAKLMSEVCLSVAAEPSLQPLRGKPSHTHTFANAGAETRAWFLELDIGH